MNVLPHKYYEENLLHFIILSMIRDFEECVRAVDAFLPYVDCWPVSDQASPRSFKKNHSKLLPYIRKWIASEHVYTARFGIRMLMNEFLEEDFREEYLDLVASKKGDDYYLKMMGAWFFATALAKRYEESVRYFEDKKLDEWVHRKAIQKAVESYRVTDELKKRVVFKVFNLMEPIPYRKHPFDLIFCRNVMIYFDSDTKNALVNRFYDVLAPGGYLFIGHAESIPRDATKFEYVKPAIYRRPE